MIEYLVKTDKKDKKTHILTVGNPAVRLGMIYTDFNLFPKMRNISKEDIVNPNTNRAIGNIKLYQGENIISVNFKRKELSALTEYGEYKENGIMIPYRKLTKTALLFKEEYKSLGDLGITHAYFLDENSPLSHIFCFERGGDISGIIYSKEPDDKNALKGLTLVLAQRIEEQDFIFEFMKI